MAIKIRLRRMGSNKKPFFRVVVTDIRRPNGGLFIEQLGWYDPKRKGVNFELDLGRVEYWKGKGAEITDTVRSLVKKCRAAAPTPEQAPAPEPTDTGPGPDRSKAVAAGAAEAQEG